MRRRNPVPRRMIWSMLVGLLMCGSLAERAQAQEDGPPPAKGLIVPINQSKDLQLSNKKIIKTVLNANENVVRVVIKVDDPKTVLVTGLLPGVSKVTLTDVDGKSEAFEI